MVIWMLNRIWLALSLLCITSEGKTTPDGNIKENWRDYHKRSSRNNFKSPWSWYIHHFIITILNFIVVNFSFQMPSKSRMEPFNFHGRSKFQTKPAINYLTHFTLVVPFHLNLPISIQIQSIPPSFSSSLDSKFSLPYK